MAQINLTVNGNIRVTAVFRQIVTTPPPTVAPTPAPTPAPVFAPTPPPTFDFDPTPAPVFDFTPAPIPVFVPPTPAPIQVFVPDPTPAPVTPAPIVAPTPAPIIAPTLPPIQGITPAPTPAPIVAPTPAPTPAPIFSWRDCLDGLIKNTSIPEGYINSPYRGAGGGTCWEPSTQIGFTPSLSEALKFNYRRGTSVYPDSKSFEVVNTTYGVNYSIKITTNPDVKLSVNGSDGKGIATFNLGPASRQKVVVSVSADLLNRLADGVSSLDVNIEATEL